ncbi:MAG: hypothetical protein ACNA7X_01510 [Dehalococcoidia bacterium]
MSFLKGVFAVAIGVLIVLLVIFGIQTFYPADTMNVYSIVLPLGAALAIVGAFVRSRQGIIGASLVLGGTGTMIFAVVPWRLDSLWRFIGIAVILAVLVLVGFMVFRSSRED